MSSSSTIRNLLELKEELKKETSGEDMSEGRTINILEEIERQCLTLTREQFIDSKIGGVVKKLSENKNALKISEFAIKLVDSWKNMFGNPNNKPVPSPSPSASSSSASSTTKHEHHQTHHQHHHDEDEHKKKIQEVTKVSGPKDEKRKKTCTFLAGAFDEDLKSQNASANLIFNVCVEIEESLHQLGQDQYTSKGRTLRLNLQKNAPLRKRILSGEVKSVELVNYTPEQLISDDHKEAISKTLSYVAESKRSDWMDANREQFNKQAGVKEQGGMFRCGKCGSTKTTHYQKQTRSAGKK
jgi:DNA-directed RNA polymerase subunit M/transcription elongation factor TFIIS